MGCDPDCRNETVTGIDPSLSNKDKSRAVRLESLRGRIAMAAALAAAIALLAGCAVGPDYTGVQAPQPASWMQAGDPTIQSNPAELDRWWTVFQDPVLNQLIETAFRQNLSLQIAGVRILESRAQLGIAVGGLFPQLQQVRGELVRTRTSKNTPNTSPTIDTRYTDVSVGFDLGWELDFWGKLRRAVESGRASLEASIAGYDDILVSLTAEVARTYVLISTLESRLAIARQNMAIQERSLKIVSLRFREGEVTELDLSQSRALVADTRASIPRLESQLRGAVNSLAILLGVLPEQIDEYLTGPRSIPAAPSELVVGIPAELMRRRPDIRLAEHRLRSQSALIGVAKADLYPHFSLIGSIGLRSSDAALTFAGFPGGSSLSNLWDGDSLEYFAGPSFRWDLFNYGRIKNQVRVQDARFQQLAVDYRNTVLRAAEEVESAIAAFLRSQEETQALRESVQAAKRAEGLALLQYREGLVDFQRVLDSQRFKTLQQDQLIASRGAIATNLVAVYKALGGGWQIRRGKSFLPQDIEEEMRQRTDWGGLLEEPKQSGTGDEPGKRPE